jgi:hypothetical protein
MFDEEDLEEDKPVVNEESIHRIVSFSQSFCDVRPEIPKGMLDRFSFEISYFVYLWDEVL